MYFPRYSENMQILCLFAKKGTGGLKKTTTQHVYSLSLQKVLRNCYVKITLFMD